MNTPCAMKQACSKLKAAIAVFAFLLLLASVVGAQAVYAQTGGGYDLTWSTIDGGGMMFSTGGGYSLGGTMGQPDAGTLGGGYTLAGGFWGGAAVQYKVYLPVVLRQSP
jgi:hypothetical protein